MAPDDPADADEPVRMALVSGFLGAGKTTALETIGTRLSDRGHTVGMITNDQASGLVDTSILDAATGEGEVVEIPGGCFCCNFEDLLTAAQSIERRGVDVLLAEPVGSCTDLVATVVNPLRSLYPDAFDVAPLTVVVDPDRVRAYLDGDGASLPEPVQYIFRLQVEEADLVVLNKTDTLDAAETDRLVAALAERVGDRPVLPVSAATGRGVDAWMAAVFDDVDTGDGIDADRQATVETRGRALADIDYDTYAAGEAELGWVNLSVDLGGPFDASQFRAGLMNRLQAGLATRGIEVAHLKFSIAADGKLVRANLTATAADPRFSGAAPGTVNTGELVVNVRAVGDPGAIRAVGEDAVEATADATDANGETERSQAFRPAYPEPAHRMAGDGGTNAGGDPNAD